VSGERARAVVYGAAEALTLGRGVPRTINGERVRFPARWSRYYPAVYEPAKFRFLRETCAPGSCAIDIGAHIGLFSVTMARAVSDDGQVICLEPSERTRAVLTRTLELNGVAAWTTVRREAVADTSGRAALHESAIAGSNANSLVAAPADSTDTTVPTVTLDELCAETSAAVSCVKIDAEGAELMILRGGRRTLERHRPALAIEVHPAMLPGAGDLAALWETLDDHGYDVATDGHAADRRSFCARRELFEIQASPRGLGIIAAQTD
jgi:FkbM family methyltransferase